MAITRSLIHDRIVIDPEILVGKPVVRGTRISVELVLKRLAEDLSLETLFEAYPHLTEDDVKACLEYAYELVAGELIFPTVLEPASSSSKAS
jgi:uncharacterized protein (DUF433 family)